MERVRIRFEKITIENYRQFREVDINFNLKTRNDMNIVIGTNGTGKTNLLNAINFCLYGDEPHLSKDSQQLPRLNLNTLNETEIDNSVFVKIEIEISLDDRTIITLLRQEKYFVVFEKGRKIPISRYMKFQITIKPEGFKSDIYENQYAEEFLERLLPKRIREFFFFDGEHLDKYFREATGQKIRNAIHQLAQVDLVSLTLEHQKKVRTDYEKIASKNNPSIAEIEQKMEQTQDGIDSLERNIDNAKNQLAIAKERIGEYNKKLHDIPDIEKLEKNLQDLRKRKKQNEKLLSLKNKEKDNLIFSNLTELLLFPTLHYSFQIIRDKQLKHEIPITIDKYLIENILSTKECICGRILKEEEEDKILILQEEISMSSSAAEQMSNMNPVLYNKIELLSKMEDKIYNITKEIINYQDQIKYHDNQILGIDNSIEGYDKEKVKDWYHERNRYEEERDRYIIDLNNWEKEKEELEIVLVKLREEFEEEIKKEGKIEQLRKQINFCNKAIDLLNQSKELIVNDLRIDMEEKTKEKFFKIIWKKETFKDITIDENYDFRLFHTLGYDCLGSLSAGEREILALSFIMALHEISGFESPIVIDTPVARISDEHRTNFSSVFRTLSENKQIISLFTPSEFSDDVSEILEPIANHKFKLSLRSQEREVVLNHE